MQQVNRILVIGSGASGKSTFAIQLAERTGLPLHHLDSYYWKPGWLAPGKEEWRRQVSQLVATDRWIIDGSYTGTLDLRVPRADLIIFFDLSRWRCLWNLLKRRVRYSAWFNARRPGMPEGCPERIFGSFVKWLWQYPEKSRPQVLAAIEKYKQPDAKLCMVHSYRELDRLLEVIGVPESYESEKQGMTSSLK